MLAERGINVDHSTIYRWVQRYAPELEKRLRWYWRHPSSLNTWHLDETYVKLNGQWIYLYRAIEQGILIFVLATASHLQISHL